MRDHAWFFQLIPAGFFAPVEIRGNMIAVRWLLQVCSDAPMAWEHAVFVAALVGRNDRACELIDERGPKSLSDRVLAAAAENQCVEVVARCVRAGISAGPHGCLQSGAAAVGNSAIVNLLLESGADVHFLGDEPLRAAAVAGHLEVVKLLLARGADVHARDNQAIEEAWHEGHLEIVRILLAAGATPPPGLIPSSLGAEDRQESRRTRGRRDKRRTRATRPRCV